MKAKRKKGDGCVYQHGTVWWIKYSRDGEPYAESSGSTKERDARQLLKKRFGEIVSGRFVGPDAEKVKVRELAEDYLNDYRVNSRKSVDKAERMIKRFDDEDQKRDSELMAYFGDCKAHNVGTDAIKKEVCRAEIGRWRRERYRQPRVGRVEAHVQPGLAGGKDSPEALHSHAERKQRASGVL